MRTVANLTVSVVVCLACVTCLHADVVRDQARQFEFVVDSAWKKLPASVVDQIAASARQSTSTATGNTSTEVTPIAAYSKDGKTTTPPFFLVMYIAESARQRTLKEVEDGLMKGFDKGFNDAAQRAGAQSTTKRKWFDQATNRFIVDVEMSVAGSKLAGRNVNAIGADGMVQFLMYTKSETSARDFQALDKVLGTFKFQPGAEFVPAAKSKRELGALDISQRMGSITAACLLGALVLWGIKKAKGR